MISRRARLRRFALRSASLLTLLGLLGGLAAYTWQQFLQRQQISQFDWQGLQLSLDGVHLRSLALQQRSASGDLAVQVAALTLHWKDFSTVAPFWQHIEADQLNLEWHPADADTDTSPAHSAYEIAQLIGPLGFAPSTLNIRQINAQLPCASGRCTLQGDLQLTRASLEPLDLNLQLNLKSRANAQTSAQSYAVTADVLTVDAQLHGTPQALNLQLALHVNQQPQLGINAQLRSLSDYSELTGAIAAPHLNQAQSLQAWLSQWALPAGITLPQAPSAAEFSATWQLQLPPGVITAEHLHNISGTVAATANLPEPWPLPGIGQVQGSFSAALTGQSGQWLAQQLSADLKLRHLTESLLSQLPAPLKNQELNLVVEPIAAVANVRESLSGHHLPLHISVTSSGVSAFELHAQLALANSLPWAVQLSQATLKGTSKDLVIDDWNARDVDATLNFNGYADEHQVSLELTKGSQLQLAQLSHPQFTATPLSSTLDKLKFSAAFNAGKLSNWQIDGPLSLTTKTLKQASLKPQSWAFKGQLQADPTRQTLEGSLSANAGLQAQLKAQNDGVNGLKLDAKFGELFLRAGNPLQQTLNDWPPLLELNNGRLNATALLRLPPGNSDLELVLDLTSTGLAGIYDRTELNGLSSDIQLKLAKQHLHAEIKKLSLQEANPGVVIGPIELRGRYSAPLSSIAQGQLTLQQATAQLLGGQVALAPNQWSIKQSNLVFPLTIKGLTLQQLFTAYPAQGLSGSGVIDGTIPLRLNSSGFSIEQGHIAAREPGGRLQFDNDKIKALGQSNPAMQLVAQSLEDFHYTTLASGVSYDTQGKLVLALRLEGRNPAIENGRPINFNINLEENIPTLLASIQLSDKVSDIIQQRVQQFILKRNQQSDPKDH